MKCQAERHRFRITFICHHCDREVISEGYLTCSERIHVVKIATEDRKIYCKKCYDSSIHTYSYGWVEAHCTPGKSFEYKDYFVYIHIENIDE